MKVIKTIWINLTGVFMAVFIHAILLSLIDANVSRNLFQAIFAALYLVCLFGFLPWMLFILLLSGLDLILFGRNQKSPEVKLLLEWLIISSPFIYWIVRYNEWIFLTGIIAFLITQLIRRKQILRYTRV
jgi:hypothetical protein